MLNAQMNFKVALDFGIDDNWEHKDFYGTAHILIRCTSVQTLRFALVSIGIKTLGEL